MDNNYNQQTETNSNSQGNSYQQNDSYANPQGNAYQQNDPYANPYGNNSYGSSYHYGSNPEPEKVPNIFQQFVLAFIPPEYNKLTKVKTGSMIGFVTLMALIATIISFVIFAFNFASIDNGEWMDAFPDFVIADGRLYIEEDFVYDESGMFVYVTDDISEFSYDTASGIAAEGYQNIILIGRNRISFMQNGEYQQADFKDFGSDMEISKDWIVDTLMPVLMVFISLGYIFFFVGRILWYFLCALIYMLIAMLIASCMKKQLSSGALYRVAVYSKVLMFVVVTFLDVLPFVHFSVPFFLRVVITIGFMGVAISKLPEKN